MKQALCILLGLMIIISCDKEDITEGTPECIEKKIEEIVDGEVWDPPTIVHSYEYMGQRVYYIPPRCCDIESILYDEDCNILCAPDGGITGEGDGRCPDFLTTRMDEKLIWEDDR